MILNIIMSNRDNDDTSSTMTMTYDWYKVRDSYQSNFMWKGISYILQGYTRNKLRGQGGAAEQGQGGGAEEGQGGAAQPPQG